VRAVCELLPRFEISLEYFELLRKRLEERGFPKDDGYYLWIEAVVNAVHAAKIWTFYMTIPNGVGVLRKS
jgi:hypothetical protein